MSTMTQYGALACQQFFHVMHAMKRAMTNCAEAHGLTMQQATVLYILHENGMQLMGAIAGHLHCDASNVTGIIERLTGMGFVERKEAAHDRRAKELYITDKGRAFVERVQADIPASVGFTKLPTADQKALYEILQKLGA